MPCSGLGLQAQAVSEEQHSERDQSDRESGRVGQNEGEQAIECKDKVRRSDIGVLGTTTLSPRIPSAARPATGKNTACRQHSASRHKICVESP
jgi:hypothetical protein